LARFVGAALFRRRRPRKAIFFAFNGISGKARDYPWLKIAPGAIMCDLFDFGGRI